MTKLKPCGDTSMCGCGRTREYVPESGLGGGYYTCSHCFRVWELETRSQQLLAVVDPDFASEFYS